MVQYLSMGMGENFSRFRLFMQMKGYSFKAVLYMWEVEGWNLCHRSDWAQRYKMLQDQMRAYYKRSGEFPWDEDDDLYIESILN
jgi:hypothetical protein